MPCGVGTPAPGQQLGQTVLRRSGDAGERVGDPGLRVGVVYLAVWTSVAMVAPRSEPAKEPCFPAEGKAAQAALRSVVRQADAPVIEEARGATDAPAYDAPGIQVATWVKSDSHSRSGARAWNWRFTWSSGKGGAMSLIVVRTGLPRITPCSPSSPISCATVQRATSGPSRRTCRQTVRTRHGRRSSRRRRGLSRASIPGHAVPWPIAAPDRAAGPAAQGRWTGRSARPCRLARSRTPLDDRR